MLGPLNKISSWSLDQLIFGFLGLSIGVHILVFTIGYFFDPQPTRSMEEWEIETDLVSESDLKPSSKTVIPKAKKSEKVTVPSNMLPQLNKDFQIKEKTKEAEGVAPPKEPEKPVEAKKEAEKADDKGEASVEDKDQATKLAKLEALKRLALEKVRQEQKEKAKELQAHEDDELAQVKEALQKDAGLRNDAGGGLLAGAANRVYSSYLRKAIRKNWALPKTFQLTDADMLTVVAIRINARGGLISVKIDETSGDAGFDQYCVDAVRNSSPYKAPPDGQAGEIIRINCIP